MIDFFFHVTAESKLFQGTVELWRAETTLSVLLPKIQLLNTLCGSMHSFPLNAKHFMLKIEAWGYKLLKKLVSSEFSHCLRGFRGSAVCPGKVLWPLAVQGWGLAASMVNPTFPAL